jgi:FkbM family methyltransferase
MVFDKLKRLYSKETRTLLEIKKRLTAIENKIDLLETFSHGARATYVGNNRVLTKVVVANHQIAFFVEADDRLLSPWFIVSGGYETDLTSFFVKSLKPDSNCLDVGCNFGYFTCLMARFCKNGRIIGIEADHHIYELARDNVFINNFSQIARVINAAASNCNAEMILHRRHTRSGNTSVVKMPDEFTKELAEQPSEPFVVKGLRVDDLLPEMNGRLDFMKVDVEGAEPLVFEGAHTTIATNPKLAIVMEWSPGQIAAASFAVRSFLDSLAALGLRPYDIDQHGLLTALTFDQLLNIPYRAGIVLKRG